MDEDYPPEFDCYVYRDRHADLSAMAPEAALSHYKRHGQREGRIASAISSRASFLSLVPDDARVLEIGPFYQPLFRGPNTRYFDVLDAEGLKARAERIGKPTAECPEVIHYVSATGDLSVVTETFDYVFSSHCIEHQPDLVRHFQQAAGILSENGCYFANIPDKRYCFDHFIAESTIADVLDAHMERRTIHTACSVIEHRALTTHNDPARHWSGDHGKPFESSQIERLNNALAELNAMHDQYIDVHAWQFTPESFRLTIDSLAGLSLTEFRSHRVYPTVRGSVEFYAILQKQR